MLTSNIVSAAWFGGNDSLVVINGVSYLPDDFKHWWDNWREPGMAFPANPDEFIDWKLLALEAKSMELDQEPTFMHKLRVFYKSRTRVLLKYDTVDSKINITEKDVEKRFYEDYSPVWRLAILFFDSETKATEAYGEIKENISSFAELKRRAPAEGGPLKVQESNFRPLSFKNNKEELEFIKNLAVGQVSRPRASGDYFVLISFEEQFMPGQDEVKSREKQIRRQLYDEQEAYYTAQLVEELKKKFQVEVDEELLATAEADMAGEILSKPIVKTSRGNLPLGMLVNDLRKEFTLRTRKTSWTQEEKDRLKRGLLNGMMAEYLLTWEAEDRHYEEKPPFKWTYEFYKESRLIKEVEKVMIASQINVTDDEAAKYYEENTQEFSPPDMLSLLQLKGDERAIKHLWVEISHGQDIFQAADAAGVEMQPLNDISAKFVDPRIIEEIDKLAIGEVSKAFPMGNDFYIVKLANRRKLEPKPFDEVQQDIILKLKNKKFAGARQEYLELVRRESDIDLNSKVWEKLKAEMTN